MWINRCLLAGCVVSLSGSWAAAQTLQLPTFQFFGVSTTVSVPDRGSMFLGGVNRSASGSNQFGPQARPFGNRSFGSNQSASGIRVTAWVHDFEAMDDMLLGHAAARGPLRAEPLTLTASTQPPASQSVASSIAVIKEQIADEDQQRHAEGLRYYERGQKMESEQRYGAAKTYYLMAFRRVQGELKREVEDRMLAMDVQSRPTSVAGR